MLDDIKTQVYNILYPPYELSYYSRGFVEFTISYEDLYGYLKPEYSALY